MQTPRLRCKKCNAFVAAPTPVLVSEPVVRSRVTRFYDALFGAAATLGFVDVLVHGFRVAHAALRARGLCP